MTKYLLGDVERNGYQDSDFYAIYWDDTIQEVGCEMYGTTRAYTPTVAPSSIYTRNIPDSELEKALAYQAFLTFHRLSQKEESNLNRPYEVSKGQKLQLLKSGIFNNKKTGEKIAYKLGDVGTVIWFGAFGYQNSLNRFNTQVGLKLENGNVIFIKLENCKLAKEKVSTKELFNEAYNFVKQNGFTSCWFN